MTRTTAELRTMTIAEMRTEADGMNARLIYDRNDIAAAYAINRIDAELLRRRRLCRTESAGGHVCALLDGHTGNHRSLTDPRPFATGV